MGSFPETQVCLMGAGEKEKGSAGVHAGTFSLFPSSPARLLLFYWDTQPAEASAEKRAVILSFVSNLSSSVANKDA